MGSIALRGPERHRYTSGRLPSTGLRSDDGSRKRGSWENPHGLTPNRLTGDVLSQIVHKRLLNGCGALSHSYNALFAKLTQGLYYVSAAEPEAVGEGSDKFPSKSTRVTIPTSVGLHPQASSGYPFPQRKVYQKQRFQDSALCRQISMGPKSDFCTKWVPVFRPLSSKRHGREGRIGPTVGLSSYIACS